MLATSYDRAGRGSQLSPSEPDPMERRIAVIIPCFNEAALLKEAVDSISEPEPVELVVVDDHSSDPDTLKILEEMGAQGVKVVRHERNRGLSAARNTGLAETSAPYVFPLDADDLAVPGSIARMADILDQRSDAAVCFGDFEEYRPNPPTLAKLRLVRAVPERLDPFRLAYSNELPSTALYRREVLEDVGGWEDPSSEVLGYEDWDLWMKLAERGLTGVHAGVGVLVFRYRIDEPRSMAGLRPKHRALYQALRARHPALFEDIRRHRAETDLPMHRRMLYPIVYGSRPRLNAEKPIKRLLDRLSLWTLQR